MKIEPLTGMALEPCPFCGSKDLQCHKDITEDKPSFYYAHHIFCCDCHCHGRNHYHIGWSETVQMAEQAWNDRRYQSPRERALERAALDFINKVHRGEVKSVKSYAAFKAALEVTDATK